MPMSWPARIESVANQSMPETRPRTVRPKWCSRRSPVVRKPCPDAWRQTRGPTQKASSSEPMPADPFHHQALRPSRYPMPVAPTVDPAPMFAASTVEKSSQALRLRPATKNALVLRTRRLTAKPSPSRAAE